MAVCISRKNEFIVSNPKTLTESLELTKLVTTVMISQILIDRRLFKNSDYNKKSILGVPVKIIKYKNDPELKFALCLRTAMEDLKKKNLQSIRLIVTSKESGNDLEEYSIRYKYENDQIRVQFSQQDDIFAEFGKSEDERLKDCIVKMLKNEKAYMDSLLPIPNDYLIKLQATYYENSIVRDSKYFKWKPVEDTLKGVGKGKLGKTETKFHTAVFCAKSTLIKHETMTEEELEEEVL